MVHLAHRSYYLSMLKRSILMVVSDPATSTTTGWPVGFWASELIHPFVEFVERGYSVRIASPSGGLVQLDALSDPRDASGYSKSDTISLEWLEKPEFAERLENTASVADCVESEFDAIVVCGGQGPMFTFEHAKSLQERFLEFHEAGKPSTALCHGVSLLLHLKTSDGSPFVRGRRVTGFSNAEEDLADESAGQKLMPFRIEDRARELGADFMVGPPFEAHAVRHGNLITGQQQNSGTRTAKLLLDALDEAGAGA